MHFLGWVMPGCSQSADDRREERTVEGLTFDPLEQRRQHSQFLFALRNAVAHVMDGMPKFERQQPLSDERRYQKVGRLRRPDPLHK